MRKTGVKKFYFKESEITSFFLKEKQMKMRKTRDKKFHFKKLEITTQKKADENEEARAKKFHFKPIFHVFKLIMTKILSN